MTQVIIHTNDNGGVSVTVPTGELPIDAVKTKDTPAGSIIVDSSTLPQGADAQFFDAWVLNGSTVSVDLNKAKSVATKQVNAMAKAEATHRMTNASIGLSNHLDDTSWLNLLNTARNNINNALSTQQLLDAMAPVQAAITANA